MLKHSGGRGGAGDPEHWDFNGSTGRGVHTFVCLLLLCIPWMNCPTVRYSLWKTAAPGSYYITSTTVCGCVCDNAWIHLSKYGWRLCVCVCVCVPPLPVRHSWICHLETELPIYSLHFSGSLTSVTEGRRAKEAWMCCERGRERVFVLKPTAASVRLRLSLWCSAVHSRESANVCVLTQSASFLRFSWKHSCTQTHSCCSGLWTDVLRESREFPSWVN